MSSEVQGILLTSGGTDQAVTAQRELYKTFNGGGLYIEVFPDGAKNRRYKYPIGGKEKRLALGVYPKVSLKDARKRHVKFAHTWSGSHRDKLLGRLKDYLFPLLGKRPINEVDAPELFAINGLVELGEWIAGFIDSVQPGIAVKKSELMHADLR